MATKSKGHIADFRNGEHSKTNSLKQFAENLAFWNVFDKPIQNVGSMFSNSRTALLTYCRQELNDRYATDGIIKAIIDDPVRDGFRGEIDIKTTQLDSDELAKLKDYIESNNIITILENLFKWNRLFGGSALLIDIKGIPLDQDFTLEDIHAGSDILFIPADRWELTKNSVEFNPVKTAEQENWGEAYQDCYYYGELVNSSHAIFLTGKPAPSLIRPRLNGWGLSAIEPLVAPLNAFDQIKNVIYEMISEAKIDLWKFKNLNDNVMTDEQRKTVVERVRLANLTKNVQNALLLDTEDEFTQRQLNLAGVSDILQQYRYEISAATEEPIAKLFGMSPSGFNTGEADVENYNTWVEGEIRNEIRRVYRRVIRLISQCLFGVAPDDIQIVFTPLRTPKTEEIEMANDRKFKRVFDLYSAKLLTSEELGQYLREENILTMDSMMLRGELPKFTEASNLADESTNFNLDI